MTQIKSRKRRTYRKKNKLRSNIRRKRRTTRRITRKKRTIRSKVLRGGKRSKRRRQRRVYTKRGGGNGSSSATDTPRLPPVIESYQDHLHYKCTDIDSPSQSNCQNELNCTYDDRSNSCVYNVTEDMYATVKKKKKKTKFMRRKGALRRVNDTIKSMFWKVERNVARQLLKPNTFIVRLGQKQPSKIQRPHVISWIDQHNKHWNYIISDRDLNTLINEKTITNIDNTGLSLPLDTPNSPLYKPLYKECTKNKFQDTCPISYPSECDWDTDENECVIKETVTHYNPSSLQ